MKNLIHRPILRMGMPYHGLVTDGELPNPDGPIAVTHSASVEGAIAFQLRTPPPAKTLSAEQIANDTAHGWEWRDYALLNGWFREVNGSEQLGELAWLYADESDQVWVMEIEGSLRLDSPNYYYDIKVWRKALFGHYRFGMADYPLILADELLATYSIYVPEVTKLVGGSPVTLPAGTFGNGMSMKASCIVPSLNGDVIHLHVINQYTSYLPGSASYWELALRSVFAKLTITLTGTGDLTNTGIGIAAAFSNVQSYPSFITKQPQIDADLATINPFPINHIGTSYTYTCDGSNPPTGPGQVCNENCDAVFTNDGVDFTGHTRRHGWDQDNVDDTNLGDSEAAIFSYHGPSAKADCLQTFYRWNNGQDYKVFLEGQGGGNTSAEMSWIATFNSATDDGGQSYYWELASQTRVCSAWKATESTAQNLYNGCGVDIGGNVDEILVDKDESSGNRSILGVGTSSDCGCISWQSDDGYPGPVGDYFTRNWIFSELYTITDVDTDAYGDVGQSCRLIVFPGMIGYVAAHAKPNGVDTNWTQIVHRGKLWGIGSDGTLTLITSWGPIEEADLLIRFPWTSVAWQPVTKQFNVQTDGATLVKYI